MFQKTAMDIIYSLLFTSFLLNFVSSFSIYQRGETPEQKLGNSKGSLIDLLIAQQSLRRSLEETAKAGEYFIGNNERNRDFQPVLFQNGGLHPKRKRQSRRRKWKRSFDSISHRSGGLENMTKENHYHRQLEELIRQQQERLQELETGQTSVPDTFESVFPILHRNIQHP